MVRSVPLMMYQGGKSKLAKHIAAQINAVGNDTYYEPFVGAASVLALVEAQNRYASDADVNIITLWRALQNGWQPPHELSREEYEALRSSKDVTPERSIAGYGCSWGGKWFGGYARGEGRNFPDEAARSVLKTLPLIQSASFSCNTYDTLFPHVPGTIYCDPPYAGTSVYTLFGEFRHDRFWDWCEEQVSYGHVVFVSECEAPDGWEVAWEREVKSGYVNGGSATRVRQEKLFVKGA